MTASGLPFSAPSPNGRGSQSIAFLMTAGMLPLYSGVTTSGVGVGRRGAQRGHRGQRRRVAGHRVVDLLVVERQLAESLEDGDDDVLAGDNARQLRDLAVDRRRAQASH